MIIGNGIIIQIRANIINIYTTPEICLIISNNIIDKACMIGLIHLTYNNTPTSITCIIIKTIVNILSSGVINFKSSHITIRISC